MKILRAASALLVLLLPVWANAQRPQVNVFWGEDASCRAWEKSAGNKAIRAHYEFWVRGFVSGYNYGNPAQQVKDGTLPSGEALYQHLDQYCREHPTLSFIGGAVRLVEELHEPIAPSKPPPAKARPPKKEPAAAAKQ